MRSTALTTQRESGTGASLIHIELPERATVEDALNVLRHRRELADLLTRIPVRIAVNREYVPATTSLRDGDEVAVIPPVAGGEGDSMSTGTTAGIERRFQVIDRPIVADDVSPFVGVASRTGKCQIA